MAEKHSQTEQIAPPLNRTMHMAVLHHIDLKGDWDIRTMSEPFRQRVIDLAMQEPPLVDIDADLVYVTHAGKKALSEWRER